MKNIFSIVMAILFVSIIIMFPARETFAVVGYHPVCGKITYFDSRTSHRNGTGSYLPTSGSDTNRPAKYVKVYLYDLDGSCIDFEDNCSEENSDDLLGTAYTDEVGEYCFNNIGDQEDLYLMTEYETLDINMYTGVGSQTYQKYRATSPWSSNTVYNDEHIDFDWSITCPKSLSGLCSGTVHADQWPTNQAFANIIATANDVIANIGWSNVHGWNGYNVKLNGHYPDFIYNSGSTVKYWCTDNGINAAGRAYGFNDFCITTTNDTNSYTVAHEIGHLVHKRSLSYGAGTATLSGGTCGTWSWTSSGSEACATAEGFANFFSAAAHWAQTSPGPFYLVGGSWRPLEANTTSGNSGTLQPCVSAATQPEVAPGNVTRYFWDLYDVPNTIDGSADNVSFSMSDIISIWTEFPSGTGNRDNNEPNGGLDPDGRNVKDYSSYESTAVGEVNLNCLNAQDSN